MANTEKNIDIHEKYSDAYIQILTVYKNQIEDSSKTKSELKKKYLYVMLGLLGVTLVGFVGCACYTTHSLKVMAMAKSANIEAVVGSMVTVLTTFSALIVEVIKIPKLIAEYLFDKAEDASFVNVISKIQEYETTMVSLEKVSSENANKVNADNSDAILESSRYINPGTGEDGPCDSNATSEDLVEEACE